MALMRCPECAREISDAAEACPACGRPLRDRGSRLGPAAARWGGAFEYRSRRTLLGLPLVHVVYGPASLVGLRPARGIVAVGNIAVGVVAFGGVAVGLVAAGGIGIGLVSVAGVALALGFGLGGVATGFVALGGVAVGVYAVGGAGIGAHTLRNDPELLHWLKGLASGG